MKIIILVMLLSIFSAPAPDPECISDWHLLWEVPNGPYCKEQDPYGDYSLFVCTIKKSSPAYGEYFTAKFKSVCQYEEQEPVAKEAHLFFIPFVTVGCPEGAWLTDGYCTIIGDPIRVP